MANTSAKRIASQNDVAIRNMRIGMISSVLLALLLRILFRRDTLPPSIGSLSVNIIASAPAVFLALYLQKIGSPRRESFTGVLISSGEDLNQAGVTDLCFDVLYVTWACQIGSGAFGDWFWCLYMVIPIYALFKLWTSFLYPMIFKKSPDSAEDDGSQTISKRQEKMRKRSERGDQRVKARAPK